MKDANILRERLEKHLRNIKRTGHGDNLVAKTLQAFIDAIDELPDVEEQDSKRARRWDTTSNHGDWELVSGSTLEGKGGVLKWRCTCCGFVQPVKGIHRPQAERCPSCKSIMDGLKPDGGASDG